MKSLNCNLLICMSSNLVYMYCVTGESGEGWGQEGQGGGEGACGL